MRPKHRKEKLKQGEKLSLRGYYEKLLWFIVNDCTDSDNEEEIVKIYLRAWNDIWSKNIRNGKPGRPRVDDSHKLRQVLIVMNENPGIKDHTAVKMVVYGDNNIPDHKKEAAVKRLERGLKRKNKKDSDVLPDKGEKYESSTIPDWIDSDTLQQDGKEFWEHQREPMLQAFLNDIKNTLQ